MAKKASDVVESAPKTEESGVAFDQYAGAGFENIRPDDIATPFLHIIQSNSPELQEDSPKFIPDAKAGMIVNSLTKQILGGRGEPVLFIPCSYKKMWVEWKQRDKGGGVVMAHDTEKVMSETTRDDKTGKDMLPNGNIVVTTVYMFGLVETEGEVEKAVISFTSTQLKKARAWLSQMFSMKMTKADGTKFIPPIWSNKYHLSTLPEKNDRGSWFGWKIELSGLIEAKLVQDAVSTAKLAAAPSVRQLPAHDEDGAGDSAF